MNVTTKQESYRDIISKLEQHSLKFPQIDIPMSHNLHGGMYSRYVTIPKGITVTGQIYKHDHFEVMISGDATVASESGPIRIKGFNLLSGHAGKKRAVTAHKKTIWLTIHPTDIKDIDKVQGSITAFDFNELDEFISCQKQIEVN